MKDRRFRFDGVVGSDTDSRLRRGEGDARAAVLVRDGEVLPFGETSASEPSSSELKSIEYALSASSPSASSAEWRLLRGVDGLSGISWYAAWISVPSRLGMKLVSYNAPITIGGSARSDLTSSALRRDGLAW